MSNNLINCADHTSDSLKNNKIHFPFLKETTYTGPRYVKASSSDPQSNSDDVMGYRLNEGSDEQTSYVLNNNEKFPSIQDYNDLFHEEGEEIQNEVKPVQ